MGVAEGGAVFSTGGWDNTVKIWSGNMVSTSETSIYQSEASTRPIRGLIFRSERLGRLRMMGRAQLRGAKEGA